MPLFAVTVQPNVRGDEDDKVSLCYGCSLFDSNVLYSSHLPCTTFCGCHGEAHAITSTADWLMTVIMLLKVTCLTTESTEILEWFSVIRYP